MPVSAAPTKELRQLRPTIPPKAFKNSLNPIYASSRYVGLVNGVERERARNKVYDEAIAAELPLVTNEHTSCKTYSIKYIGQTNALSQSNTFYFDLSNKGNFGITSRKQPILTRTHPSYKSLSSIKL